VSDNVSGTLPSADRHRIDVDRLAAWMRANVEGFSGPLTVEQFRGGQSNPTYLLGTPSLRYVMRSKPAPVAQLLPSAHAIEREFRVMGALRGSGVPVPRMLAQCADESVLGRAFFIMEFIEGRVLWDQTLPGFDRAGRAAIYDEMNRVIAALHAIDPTVVGLGDYGRPGNYLSRQIDRWSRQYKASETESIIAMDHLIEWLPGRIPVREAVAVVHGDFRMDNLVFHPTEPRVLAVLDWELSTLGDPLADFSYHCLSWHIPPGRFRGIAGEDIAALGIPPEADYVARYGQRLGALRASSAGAAPDQGSATHGSATHGSATQGGADRTTVASGAAGAIADWDFYIAYNLFRLAAILQGIMKRHVEGIAASEQAAEAGSRARWLAETGWTIARRLESTRKG
jgi:aminoglycoside phosphotransferase (APT) family kinase protein